MLGPLSRFDPAIHIPQANALPTELNHTPINEDDDDNAAAEIIIY